MKSPYARKKELELEIEVLQVDEQHFKNIPTKRGQYKRIKQEEETKSKIFFATMELLIIKDCIEYFEKQFVKQKERIIKIIKSHIEPTYPINCKSIIDEINKQFANSGENVK